MTFVEGASVLVNPLHEEVWMLVDAVGCEVCSTIAPADIWNGTIPARLLAVLRHADSPSASLPAGTFAPWPEVTPAQPEFPVGAHMIPACEAMAAASRARADAIDRVDEEEPVQGDPAKEHRDLADMLECFGRCIKAESDRADRAEAALARSLAGDGR